MTVALLDIHAKLYSLAASQSAHTWLPLTCRIVWPAPGSTAELLLFWNNHAENVQQNCQLHKALRVWANYKTMNTLFYLIQKIENMFFEIRMELQKYGRKQLFT